MPKFLANYTNVNIRLFSGQLLCKLMILTIGIGKQHAVTFIAF